MRIAFVGKGGSGKSTLSASFVQYLLKETNKPIVVFDADLNIHIPELLGFDSIFFDKHISAPKPSEEIKRWLIGENDIKDLGAFRKTTPPTRKSNIIKVESIQNTPLSKYGVHKNNLSVFVVGTYQEDEIGATCYHNNLATFESILNHTDDKEGFLIADMVAGVDAFAGTLHAQFDLTCLIVESTIRSIEVYKKYIELATVAGVAQRVKVIGNKIRNRSDENFIKEHIQENNIIGYFYDDGHIRNIEQQGTCLELNKLNDNNKKVLGTIFEYTQSLPDIRQIRLQKIHELHKTYVAQSFVKERFGDLTNQIDLEFTFDYEPKN